MLVLAADLPRFCCPGAGPRRHQMRLATEEHPVMLAEPSHNTKEAREKAVQLMFEKYNVPGEPACLLLLSSRGQPRWQRGSPAASCCVLRRLSAPALRLHLSD